ncbi:phage terminase large subunit family protein [Janthinobacterium psychrotolerans]|uniref:Phage terminase, large subunit GpA n=1 Tax=Janthinobacterium psychrotolerans TaxID=1747903 RepID=A0A1A7BW22_9BURK|nr:phage terminase large subunit family protein [Janthinobacterium psychrotolerans]OBV37712.1 Phage terminase, large subunit GpA [Janthinobacterium psychrotolerans]
MNGAIDTVSGAAARGLEPDPNMTVDEWADEFMIIPKDSGANEYGKYRSSRTPHARFVMRALSDNHPCKRVVLKGASQMLKTQVGLNWFGASVHQSPANFLWILPTGNLAKRTSARISKTIEAVPQLKERVAAPRSRDKVNTLDTKQYIGGALTIVTSGAAANLSELPARRVLYDEIDRAEANVNGEGATWKLAEARQTTFEKNRKSYYPSSPTIEGESAIDELFQMGTKQEALADCPHCGHEQTLVFERMHLSDDGQFAQYPCVACDYEMVESDKGKMFARGAWSEGVAGDGDTVSLTISGMFLPYGWFPWLGLLKEYAEAKIQLGLGNEELMITFYNTRLARCWERAKEQTKYDNLKNRAENYRLGTVPAGGLQLTASIDTQNDRLEFKAVAWGEGLEGWIIDYQIIHGDPSDEAVWKRAAELVKTQYRHAYGEMMRIEAVFIDSGGAHTQDVYNFTHEHRRRGIYAIKGASKPGRPIISTKPSPVDIDARGKTERRSGQLWLIGSDTAKDYLAGRWKRVDGPGAIHFSTDLPEEYYKQLTSEYRVTVTKRGRKTSIWDKKQSDRNEALDLMVYNLAAAHHLGLHRKPESYWQSRRDKLNPRNFDMFKLLDAPVAPAAPFIEPAPAPDASLVGEQTPVTPAPAIIPAPAPVAPERAAAAAPVARVSGGRISLAGTRRAA